MKIVFTSTTGKSIFAMALVVVLNSCGSGISSENENIGSEDTAATTAKNIKVGKTQNIFYSIPSPIETVVLLKKAGATFNKDYLNPSSNISRYTSTSSRALNLGVYGTDLSFANVFNQTQDIMIYLKCANNLAGSMGISNAFGQETLARVETNMDNKDSLMTIISDAFWTTDAYLKENGRPGISSLIITGGWIEGLYVATQIAKNTNNQEIILRISEQKLSLTNMIALLESYEADENTKVVLLELKELKKIFDGMEITKSETALVTNKKTGITTIGNKSKILMTPVQLKSIYEKIESIRNTIIK